MISGASHRAVAQAADSVAQDADSTASPSAISHELIAIRDRIDALDSELVRLLALRLALVTSAAEEKADREHVGDPARVEIVLGQIRARAVSCGAHPDAVETIYRTIVEQGIALEGVAYEQRAEQTGATELPAPGGPPRTPALAEDAAMGVAADRLLSFMATMRAMRRLDDRPVAQEVLDRLVQVASWAPIGANLQDYRFVIVTDRSRLARLAPHWSRSMQFYLAALRPSLAPSELQRFERVRAAMDYQRLHFERTPALIVVCRQPVSFWKRLTNGPRGSLRALAALRPRERLRVLSNLRRWGRRADAASVYPAVENLLLAARAHGLGATLTTWHSAFEQDFKSVLEIPRAVHIYAIVPVGYPLGRFGPVRRRPVEQLVGREQWQR